MIFLVTVSEKFIFNLEKLVFIELEGNLSISIVVSAVTWI